ncbi:hypothetical protein AVU38_gp159 [Ralstonia phage RSL2]|uniref:Uncharacterized protein n=1 Tax=Ralstonia phage RSL2 TaxID=1585840 RepID=A0A0A8J8X9_9CAUD|nr:hypothetical protein AVU38_gp159 [Ralstonia phage RSL2]BAQ02687.1 hypothetical protein [Ralstonia phage RSL2]
MSIFQFILTYDFDRPEAETLCDLIYISNKYKLPPPMATFGTPKALDQRPDIEDDPNTYIPAKINPKFDHRMFPTETGFLYHRIPLAALRVVDDSVIQPLAIPFKTYDILDQINRQLGVRLTENDLVNTEYTTMDDDFVITALPTSKIWMGWRYINVLGGGKKNLLFPNYLLFGFLSATSIQADKKTQLTSIANHDSAVNWQEMIDFDFGAMESVSVAPAGRNTRIYVYAHKQGYVDQWLYYTRVSPSTINDQFAGGNIPTVLVPNDPFTVYSILDQINAALGLNLTADDIENTAFEPGLSEYPITFKKTSLAWLPGTYTLKVTYDTPTIINVRLVGDGSYRVGTTGGDARTYV